MAAGQQTPSLSGPGTARSPRRSLCLCSGAVRECPKFEAAPAIDAAFLSLAKADHGGKLPSSAVRAEYLTGKSELISKCAESPAFLALQIDRATAGLAYDGITQSRLRTIDNAWPLIRAEKGRRNCETTFADFLLLGRAARRQPASTLLKAGCAAIGLGRRNWRHCRDRPHRPCSSRSREGRRPGTPPQSGNGKQENCRTRRACLRSRHHGSRDEWRPTHTP